MNNEDIKALIEKYYRAETTLEEEMQLREYFSKEENKKEDPQLAGLLELYGRFEEIAPEEELVNSKTPPPFKSRAGIPWYYSAAAAVVFLLVGFFVGKSWEQNSRHSRQLTELNRELMEIRSIITYQQLESMSASEKINVAYQYREKDSLDAEMINTLIGVFQLDENINVRLAAADALAKFGSNDKIRAAFLNALKVETNPVLQIKLIDVLVLSNETRAIPALQRIMKAVDQNEVVKERAAYGISQLI